MSRSSILTRPAVRRVMEQVPTRDREALEKTGFIRRLSRKRSARAVILAIREALRLRKELQTDQLVGPRIYILDRRSGLLTDVIVMED